MNISILSVFPELYDTFLKTSLLKKAQENGILSFHLDTFFSFVQPKERIDSPTFGPGAGMLIKPEVIQKAIESTEQKIGKAFKIFLSPQGKKVNQKLLRAIVKKSQSYDHVMLVASRYEGIDDRVEQEYADMVVSVGDFVVMGGDIPAMLLIEGFTRLLPGIVGKEESIQKESFAGPFLDHPEYTEPVTWKNREVPAIIRSGNHAAIAAWREQVAARRTILDHFDWLRSYDMNKHEKGLAQKVIPPHYVVLMHADVNLPHDQVGTTSVTSLDIHDIARSAKTYGLKHYFIVTPLKDQQRIVQKLLDFWQTGHGIEYNKQRHEAVNQVSVVDDLDAVIAKIESIEGKKPILITTSARTEQHDRIISYFDQGKVWQKDRPVLFIFGTGKGLSNKIIERSDFLLKPLIGFSDFNHLSVRSAAAIIFDRWLGISPSNG